MAKKTNNTLIYIIGFGILYLLYKESKKRNVINVTNIIPDKREVSELDEPRRFYDSKFISRKQMAINVPTRGEPPEYQQVGIIKGEGDENIKPLYGRQTYRGSNQWNYFTSLDSHLATKIPVYLGDSDCTDERGCKELNKDDTLSMGEQGPEYTASIYGTVAPRYIPY
tara:strand:- start:318 stop:821 length:504 start_codon:yes stop_codon:yes gene_type:complete